MKKTTYFAITLAIAAILLTGCQESESAQLRRARLVGNENLKLKKQLEEKDQQIQSLKDEIARLEKEIMEQQKEFGETTLKTLEIIPGMQEQVEILTAENTALREKLKQLQNN